MYFNRVQEKDEQDTDILSKSWSKYWENLKKKISPYYFFNDFGKNNNVFFEKINIQGFSKKDTNKILRQVDPLIYRPDKTSKILGDNTNNIKYSKQEMSDEEWHSPTHKKRKLC